MIDDTQGFVGLNEGGLDLPPALFDEAASANAQPVQPIPAGGPAASVQRTSRVRALLGAKTKAFVLVVVGGLAFGTLGGTMLVREGHSTPDGAQGNQAELAETSAVPDATPEIDSSDATMGLGAFAGALPRADQASSGKRRHRLRPRVQGAPRAYRVTVIR